MSDTNNPNLEPGPSVPLEPTPGNPPPAAGPDAALDALAATGVTADDVAAANALPAPADPTQIGIGSVETRIGAVEQSVANIFGIVQEIGAFIDLLRGHFGNKLPIPPAPTDGG